MTPLARRELGVAVLLCLLGAFVVLVAATNAWGTVEVLPSALAPGRTVEVPGNQVAPGVRALGIVGLAGVVALAATRGRGRTLVGLLLLGVGAGVVAATLAADPAPELLREAAVGGGQVSDVLGSTGWPPLAVVGGVLLALAGLLVTARGRTWSALSDKYRPPAVRPEVAPAAGPVQDRALWEALDRGEDPTQRLS